MKSGPLDCFHTSLPLLHIQLVVKVVSLQVRGDRGRREAPGPLLTLSRPWPTPETQLKPLLHISATSYYTGAKLDHVFSRANKGSVLDKNGGLGPSEADGRVQADVSGEINP